MSLHLYDTALLNKISAWVKDPNLLILKPEDSTRFLEISLYEENDKSLSLPLVALSRGDSISIEAASKQTKTFNGFKQATSERLNIPINVIPINITYKLDIYTRTLVEADEYLRNFIFNFINYPKLTVDIPYNDLNLSHIANISLGDSVSDTGDIQKHLFADQFYKHSIDLTVDDAYLFSVPINKVPVLANVKTEIR